MMELAPIVAAIGGIVSSVAALSLIIEVALFFA
jgi:hypothetical protein